MDKHGERRKRTNMSTIRVGERGEEEEEKRRRREDEEKRVHKHSRRYNIDVCMQMWGRVEITERERWGSMVWWSFPFSFPSFNEGNRSTERREITDQKLKFTDSTSLLAIRSVSSTKNRRQSHCLMFIDDIPLHWMNDRNVSSHPFTLKFLAADDVTQRGSSLNRFEPAQLSKVFAKTGERRTSWDSTFVNRTWSIQLDDLPRYEVCPQLTTQGRISN